MLHDSPIAFDPDFDTPKPAVARNIPPKTAFFFGLAVALAISCIVGIGIFLFAVL